MNEYGTYLIKLNNKHRKHQIWARIMSVLMCITVFITTYALILPAVTLDTSDPSVPKINWGMITWNGTDQVFDNLSITVNANKDTTYVLEVSTDGGSTWATADGYSVKTPKNNFTSGDPYTLWEPSAALTQLFLDPSAGLNTRYRVRWGDDNNGGKTATYDFADILEEIKPGFKSWMAGDLVNELKRTAPTTRTECLAAFNDFYALPGAALNVSQQTAATDPVSATVVMEPEGTYQYQWFTSDGTGPWTELTSVTAASIPDASAVLPEFGAYVRCRVLDEDGDFVISTPTVYVNPREYDFRGAISNINTGLGLSSVTGMNSVTYDLSIDGHIFNDLFYYTESAMNPDVPFFDAASYRFLLCKTYIRAKDSGAGDEDALTEVRMIWNRYLYDLFDPSSASKQFDNTDGSYPDGDGAGYADGTLQWPKDNYTSFHGNFAPVINDLSYKFKEEGVDYSNFISGLDKYAQADAPGDANSERKYTIDLIADGQAKARAPIALIFQIQTSWQMFDVKHANATTSDGKTKVGRLAEVLDIATLYDIKYGILDFLNYMDEYYPGNNVVIGVTEVQHAKSQTMFTGTNSSGGDLHVTNDMELFRQALYNWDIFGNCEHVHYDTDAITDAVDGLETSLKGWRDFYENDIAYEDIRKIGVVIGGATENTAGTDGYLCSVTWSNFASAGFNSVYGIQTDLAINPINSLGITSWLEYSANTGTPYQDGVGTGFTKKFFALDRADVGDALREIAGREFRKGGIELNALDKTVEEVYIHDTVKPEFEMDYEKPIHGILRRKDGSLMFDVEVQFDENGGYTVTQSVYDEDGVKTGEHDLTAGAVLIKAPAQSLQAGEKSKLTLSFTQPQDIVLNLMAGPEERSYESHNVLTIVEKEDKTTDVEYTFDILYNSMKAELSFGVVAREDYLGSNNVFTNEQLPFASYTHTGTDEKGNPKVYRYQALCFDNPEVNVPIMFDAVNGDSTVVPAGTTLDLETLDEGVIPADVLDRLSKGYKQLNGTLRFDWIQPNQDMVSVGTVHFKNGVKESEYPPLNDEYLFTDPGDYIGELRITFIPDAVTDNGNFHDDGVTPVAVNRKRDSGYVAIKVLDSNATTDLQLIKIWKGTPGAAELEFRLVDQNGNYYTGGGSDPILYTLSAANDWTLQITGLPAIVDGEVVEYTAEELEIPNYTSETESKLAVTYYYSGNMKGTFTPTEPTNGTQYLRVTYVYDGAEHTMLLPSSESPEAQSLTAGTDFEFLIPGLTADADGNTAAGYVKRIDYLDSADMDAGAYVACVNTEYQPYSSELQRVQTLMLNVTNGTTTEYKNDKVFTISYSDGHGHSGTYEGKLTSKLEKGKSYTGLELDMVPYSTYPYQITSIKYNGADFTETCSLSAAACKPIITFVNSAGEKIGKGKTVTVLIKDENDNEYTLSLSIGSDLNNGASYTQTVDQYLPDGDYEIVSVTWAKDKNNSFNLTAGADIDLEKYYRMSASMASPSDIPAGTSVTVTYEENGVEKTFTTTTTAAVEAGQTLTVDNPDIVNVSGGTFKVTQFSRSVGSGKNAKQLPYYLPLNVETEIYSTVSGFTSSSDVTVTNTPEIKMPSTGASGTHSLVMTGLCLMAGAIVSGYILRRKRERRQW